MATSLANRHAPDLGGRLRLRPGHGFGFAGALTELGLPKGARLASLLGFNLGVELGPLLVVAAVLPLLFALRRPRWYARVAMPLGSLAIAALAGDWLVQRLAS